jgi:outer membrane lipase/esterase
VGDPTDTSRSDDLSRLVGIYNDTLVNGVGGRVALVDSDAVLSAVLDDPARFGFSNIGQLQRQAFVCTGSSVQCVQPGAGDPDGINYNNDPQIANLDLVFADPVHPSSEAHNVLAKIAGAALTGIGQIGAMPVATISALRQQSLGLEQRLNLGAFFVNDDTGARIRRPVGNVEVYGGIEGGFYESDTQQVVPGFDAETQVVKAAVDTMVTPNVMVGIGGSIDHGQVEFEDGQGGFDSRLFIGGVFGVAQIVPGVYVDGFLGGGIIESVDVERNYGITDIDGNRVTTERYKGDTDGTYFIARTNVGAVLPVGNGFFINPSAGFAFERVDINGYTERAQGTSTTATQATVGDLEYVGYRGTLALGGFYRPPSDPSWTLGLRASWEHDFNDDEISVPFALGASPLNNQKAPRPDDSYGLLAATVVKELSHSTSANLQASTVVGQDGVSGYTLGLVFKHTF